MALAKASLFELQAAQRLIEGFCIFNFEAKAVHLRDIMNGLSSPTPEGRNSSIRTSAEITALLRLAADLERRVGD